MSRANHLKSELPLNHGLLSPSARRGAFSLVELAIVVVIIGIVAAIAVPRMTRGSSGADDSATSEDLALLRNAVDMYQSEHNGLYPAPTSTISLTDLLLRYSDQYGQKVSTTKDAGAKIIYGPYLRTIPTISVGPNKGAGGIAISTTSGVTASGGPGIGWLYNAVDGTFQAYTGDVAHDSAGKLYLSY